jgi:hypothetical protein
MLFPPRTLLLNVTEERHDVPETTVPIIVSLSFSDYAHVILDGGDVAMYSRR